MDVQCQARGDMELTADKLWLGFGECCWNVMILFTLIFELRLIEIDQDLIRPKLDNVLHKYYFCTFGFELVTTSLI